MTRRVAPDRTGFGAGAGVLLVMLAIAPSYGSQSPATASAPPCEPVAGLAELLAPGRVLLLGELHGTAESPAFVRSVACHAVRAGLDVVVGLELPSTLEADVERFLVSPGGEEDRNALRAHRVWQRDYQDGRTSRAMFELIDGVRRLQGHGPAVGLALFDASGARGGQARDRAMAANLSRSIAASPRAVHVILTGNIHSRTVTGTRFDRTYEPMGYLLSRAVPRERWIALNVGHAGGTAWMCAPTCGIVTISGRSSAPRWSIEIDEATRPAGHDGWYHVGAVSASPPAAGANHGSVSSRAEATSPTLPSPPAGEPGVPAGLPSELGQPRATADAPGTPPPPPAEESAAAVKALQGHWQAYEYGAKSWTLRIEGSRFRGELGPDDWYEGRITIHSDRQPAGIDFRIEDCRCDFRGETSRGIYRWSDDAVILAAPRPGSARPTVLDERSGQVVRLERIE